MAKTKPINPQKQLSVKEKMKRMEMAFTNLSNAFSLYIEYNKDGKGFSRFLEERMTQAKKEAEEKAKSEEN